MDVLFSRSNKNLKLNKISYSFDLMPSVILKWISSLSVTMWFEFTEFLIKTANVLLSFFLINISKVFLLYQILKT